jgi:nicotinate-nucleotide adenylyltransferase
VRKDKERIGLFGGTFDPVHAGHLAIAERAAQQLRLDRVIFIPAAVPPHKKKPTASYGHRVAMLEAALAGNGESAGAGQGRFNISLLESELPVPSYTVDTLLELKKRLAGHSTFYFIIGADSLLELRLWYRYQDLIRLTGFIVVSRPGISVTAMHRAIERLPGPFLPDASKQLWRCANESDGSEIALVSNTLSHNISSSAARRQLRNREQPNVLPVRVLRYIMQQGLYQTVQSNRLNLFKNSKIVDFE